MNKNDRNKIFGVRTRRAVVLYTLGAAALVVSAAESQEALPAFARDMLAAHNEVRRKAGTPPLKWSNKLAARAGEWARTLAASGDSKMQGIPGQNIGYTAPPGRVKGADVVAAWSAESANYDHEKNACVDPKLRCNHYTQVVWRASSSLGCAVARDAQRDIWVCDYDPPGNNVAEKPY